MQDAYSVHACDIQKNTHIHIMDWNKRLRISPRRGSGRNYKRQIMAICHGMRLGSLFRSN